MIPLLVPSPVLLDQSFPRNEAELLTAAVALGELESTLAANKAHLILTAPLQSLVEDFCWERETTPVLFELYTLLQQWFLQPHSALYIVRNLPPAPAAKHPAPSSCTEGPLLDYWKEEAAKLLILHDSKCEPGVFFIGVTCASSFAGYAKSDYGNKLESRHFPLVGPKDLIILGDAYRWDLRTNIHGRPVSFSEAKKNIKALGGTIHNPSGGSHYRVTFHGTRSWTLDPNDDPVPDTYLDQLKAITGLPLGVIKYTLVNGRLPPRLFRLADYLD